MSKVIGNYAVIDRDGAVVNVIAWDGKSKFNPGDGLSLAPYDKAVHEPLRKQEAVDDAPPEDEVVTLKKRLAALEKKVK